VQSKVSKKDQTQIIVSYLQYKYGEEYHGCR
jgi:hypothetical protein